jgi:hypothetical protein
MENTYLFCNYLRVIYRYLGVILQLFAGIVAGFCDLSIKEEDSARSKIRGVMR